MEMRRKTCVLTLEGAAESKPMSYCVSGNPESPIPTQGRQGGCEMLSRCKKEQLLPLSLFMTTVSEVAGHFDEPQKSESSQGLGPSLM